MYSTLPAVGDDGVAAVMVTGPASVPRPVKMALISVELNPQLTKVVVCSKPLNGAEARAGQFKNIDAVGPVLRARALRTRAGTAFSEEQPLSMPATFVQAAILNRGTVCNEVHS